MPRPVEQLVGVNDPRFSHGLARLEQASGGFGHDLRLVSESAVRLQQIIGDLSLHPHDTKPRELHMSLMEKVRRDNETLTQICGLAGSCDVKQTIAAAVQVVRSVAGERSYWVLKRAVAKKLMKNMPPQAVMKTLSYRSVDSLLKHESIESLYCLMRLLETPQWLQSFNQQYRQVKPSDFEQRKLQVLLLDDARYASAAARFFEARRHTVLHSKELGVVAAAVPDALPSRGALLHTTLFLLEYASEVHLYSAYIKLQQVSADFGQKLVAALNHDVPRAVRLAGHDVHWRSVHRALDDTAAQHFQPYITPEDLRSLSPSEQFAGLDKTFEFWSGSDHAARILDGQLVSGNILDASSAHVLSSQVSHKNIHHAQKSAMAELLARYASTSRFRPLVLQQLSA